ncbi:ATP-binding protein [candidate division KSB1 bacterium]|nr:ATP-binding protein [candidate division KSB1 bacterium]
MAHLRRSPFKVNIPEKDPNAFGLRAKEISMCVEALFNSRNVLISGPRGIGKSSLANQLQTILQGDNTLLKRCGIETTFPKTLCLFHACDKENTLDQLALDILYSIEQKCLLLQDTESRNIKPSFEINLGVFKAKLESETENKKRSPATIASQFVAGLCFALKTLQKHRLFRGLNILIDEVDQLASDINFGHFIEIVHETINNQGLQGITFIFAGQKGVYARFISEDQSFERLIKHVPISTLDSEASDYILEYAATKASPAFKIDEKGKALILSISSGYPYVLHLLGDAAYMVMEDLKKMTLQDVLEGMETVLKSDKREKYSEQLRELTKTERQVLIALSEFSTDSIPARIPVDWLIKRILDHFSEKKELENILDSLVQKGHITLRNDRTICAFSEELFRIFIAMVRIEQHEFQLRIASKQEKTRLQQEYDERLLSMINSGQMDFWDDLDDSEKRKVLKKLRVDIEEAEYLTDWDEDYIYSII